MDRRQFGDLARALAEGHLTRRRAWHVLGGGALAFVVTALADAIGQAKGDGHARSQGDRNRRSRQFQCKPANSGCIHNPPKGRPSTGKLCRWCCQTFRKVSKRAGVCCIPNGQPCESAAQCCLGVCSAGLCQNTSIQLPPPRRLLDPCTTAVDCNPGVQVGDVCPNVPNQCAQIQSQKGSRTCGTPGSGGVAVCCRPRCGFCSDDCECCGDLRCQNGTCEPPPSCAGRDQPCTVDMPCCLTLGDTVSCIDGFCSGGT